MAGKMFQSSPSPKAGSYRPMGVWLSQRPKFQSSPSPKAGSYGINGRRKTIGGGFNPLPARRPGATRNFETLSAATPSFQSSPSPKAGSYLRLRLLMAMQTSFNPLPARRPGATCGGRGYRGSAVVSILSQPEGRELRPGCRRNIQRSHVSILSQPEGRELRNLGLTCWLMSRFQSSPSPKAGSYER